MSVERLILLGFQKGFLFESSNARFECGCARMTAGISVMDVPADFLPGCDIIDAEDIITL